MIKNEISSKLEAAKKQAATNVIAAIKSIGGFYPFETSEKKESVSNAPVLTIKDNDRVFRFRVTSVDVNSTNRLTIYGIALEGGKFVQSDGMDIFAEDLARLIDCIPGAKPTYHDIKTDMAMDQVTHWFETTEGEKLFIPYHWGTKIDLEQRIYVQVDDPAYTACELPTLQQLMDSKLVKRKPRFPYRTARVDFDIYPDEIEEKNWELDIPSIRQDFEKQGFDVTEEAIAHNFQAWLSGMKCGYCDQAKGYHLFTPCGANPLSFCATSLHPACSDWQTTYSC